MALFAAFCVIETRSGHPMLPLAVFRSRQFSAANAVTFVVYGALGGALFLVPVVLQEVSGYSPLEAGIALLPLTVIMLLLSARSAALAARIGPRLQMTVGPLLIAAGMLLFTRVEGDGDYVTQVLPAVLVLGFGLATNVAPLTATALSAAPAEHAGIASAVNNDVARSASLIAVAVLPALAGLTGDGVPAPGRADAGLPHRHADRRRRRGGWRHPGRPHDPQPAPAGPPAGQARRRGTCQATAAPVPPAAAATAPVPPAPPGTTPSEGAVSFLHCCGLDAPPLPHGHPRATAASVGLGAHVPRPPRPGFELPRSGLGAPMTRIELSLGAPRPIELALGAPRPESESDGLACPRAGMQVMRRGGKRAEPRTRSDS